MGIDINSKEIDYLLVQIEAERRRKLADYENGIEFNYIDPHNNVDKLTLYNNNIVLARRGCGKTSLILKSIRKIDDITVKCDCQTIRAKSADDIILHILSALVKELKIYTNTYYTNQNDKYIEQTCGLIGFFKKHFSRKLKDEKKILSGIEAYNRYLSKMELLVNNLSRIPEQITVEVVEQSKESYTSSESKSKHFKASLISDISMAGDISFASIESKISTEADIISDWNSSIETNRST